MTKQTLEERFWSKVAIAGPDDCWPWLGARKQTGHGDFGIGSKTVRAHRFAYEFQNGPIPEGLVVRHKCGFAPCCNPFHLELGTHTENMRDKARDKHKPRLDFSHPLPYARPWSKLHGSQELVDDPIVVINGRRGVRRICQQCQHEFAADRYWVRAGQAKFCGEHCYHEHQRHLSVEDNFWQNIQKTDTCWLWTGTIDRNGYGILHSRKLDGSKMAHRFSYELRYGPIPDGLYVCHNCPIQDTRNCCNPEHLFLGDQAANIADAVQKGRMRHGTQHHSSKLDSDRIELIFELYEAGDSHRTIAKKLGVTHMTIGRVLRNQSWQHISKPDVVLRDGVSILNDSKVIEILNRLKLGERQSSLAREMEVNPSTIHSIVRGQSWNHIPRP